MAKYMPAVAAKSRVTARPRPVLAGSGVPGPTWCSGTRRACCPRHLRSSDNRGGELPRSARRSSRGTGHVRVRVPRDGRFWCLPIGRRISLESAAKVHVRGERGTGRVPTVRRFGAMKGGSEVRDEVEVSVGETSRPRPAMDAKLGAGNARRSPTRRSVRGTARRGAESPALPDLPEPGGPVVDVFHVPRTTVRSIACGSRKIEGNSQTLEVQMRRADRPGVVRTYQHAYNVFHAIYGPVATKAGF